jgi:hypothetical protein
MMSDMIQRLALGLAVVVFAIFGFIVKPHPEGYSNLLTDVSWPNCKIRPSVTYDTGIIGVTDGLDFKSNPCLSKQTSWYLNYSLYENTGYPGRRLAQRYNTYPLNCNATNDVCLAYNYGYNASLYALKYAHVSNAHSVFWWLDVETDNSWTRNSYINRANIIGAINGITQNTFLTSIGIYSAPSQWNHLTNSWINDYPEWLGTGSTNLNQVQPLCKSKSFTGGPIWLTQYTTKLDDNYQCSDSFIDSLN